MDKLGKVAVSVLNSALDLWNNALDKVFELLMQLPNQIYGGGIWILVLDIFAVLQGIGMSLIPLFFLFNMTTDSLDFFEDQRKSKSYWIKNFLWLIVSVFLVGSATNLLLYIYEICIGTIGKVVGRAGSLTSYSHLSLSGDLLKYIKKADMGTAMACFAIAILAWVVIALCSILIIITVYLRMFKLYGYIAVSPIPLAGMAGEKTSFMGKNFLKSFIAVGLEGVVITVFCLIFNIYVSVQTDYTFSEIPTLTAFNIEYRALDDSYVLVWSDAVDNQDLNNVDGYEDMQEKWSDYCTQKKEKDGIVGIWNWKQYCDAWGVSQGKDGKEMYNQLKTQFYNDFGSLTVADVGVGSLISSISNMALVMLVLVVAVKGSDSLVNKFFGL